MSTKTLTITEEAYDRLNAIKEPDENFSEVIARIAGRANIMEIASLLSETEAKDLEKVYLTLDRALQNDLRD